MANGAWLRNTVIADDQPAKTTFSILRYRTLLQLRSIVDEFATTRPTDADARKIGDYYRAFMNEAEIDAVGLSPIADIFEQINDLDSHDDIAAFFGSSNVIGVDAPIHVFIGPDLQAPNRHVLYLGQSGIGLPDRNDYIADDDRSLRVLVAYKYYVSRLLMQIGLPSPTTAAERVVGIERQLAAVQWDRLRNRDPLLRNNEFSAAELRDLFGQFPIDRYLTALGIDDIDAGIVAQPSYARDFGSLFAEISVSDWRLYLHYKTVDSFSSFLTQKLQTAVFEFYGQELQGRAQPEPRWKRAIANLNRHMGFALGRHYVDRHFAPVQRARIDNIVDHLLRAYDESLQHAPWLSDETRTEALNKLRRMSRKIGHPTVWRDYAGLQIEADDLVGNVRRARTFAHMRNIGRLDVPVDPEEWLLLPQTVNAYYNPSQNEFVFPAAMLQAPFFDADADDARNYGSIGVIIGHEIGHAFDTQGSRYDADGQLRNWWTPTDRQRFERLGEQLAAQFSAYQPLDGMPIDGQLTLGESIGDVNGTTAALRAYELSLIGASAPEIDGFSGHQRFFLGMAQTWRAVVRPAAMAQRLKTDPHAPAEYRVNGTVRNIDAFYTTFGVDADDVLFLPAADRVIFW